MLGRALACLRFPRHVLNRPRLRGHYGVVDIDSELIEAVAAGEEGAFASLISRRGPLVSAFVHRRCSGWMDAEEIVNDVWIGCWRGASKFRYECSVRAWLLGIARNQVMARYRAQSRRPHLVELPDPPPATDPGPLEQVMSGEGAAELVTAIRSLSPKLYETAMLAWLEELPYAEIAEILGVPKGTVKSRVSLARSHLRDVLATDSEPAAPRGRKDHHR